MKVSFTKAIEFHPEWRNNLDLPKKQQIVIHLSPLEHDDFLMVIDRMRKIMVDRDDLANIADDARASQQVIDLIEQTGHMIPKYVHQVDNLQGDDEDIGPEDITKYSFFFELGMEIMNHLVDISTPDEDEEKNSGPQPD